MTLAGQRAFTDLGTPLSEVPFCVLDLETTGVSPDTCEITEIGAIRYEGGIETDRFHTLVNPRSPIPPTVTVMTGITQAMVIDAPLIEGALPSFLELLRDAVIVGHNVRFDVSFLNAAAIRLGYGRLPNRSVDTLRLARRLLRSEVRNLKLESLAAHLGSPTTPNHRAFDDALATAHVFWALLERAGSIGVTHLDDLLELPTIKGSRAIGKLALTEKLPRTPGVYVFRGAGDAPLYVGKATNLRSRVRSYFAGDERRRMDDLLRQVTAIDHQATTCELEAAITELRMIHDHRPPFNKRSKPPRSLHWVSVTKERYPRLSITRSPGRSVASLGPFRSRGTAERVMHTLWDASPIRRCTAKGRGCDYAQLGVTVCPCDGSIGEAEYHAIVDELVHGITRDPSLLYGRVHARLEELSDHLRYEEAATLRDGWASLASAIERARAWKALTGAGTITARRDDHIVSMTSGRLDAAWRPGTTQPLRTVATPSGEHPTTMAASDEALALWRWLDDPRTRLLHVSASLTLPAWPIPSMRLLGPKGTP